MLFLLHFKWIHDKEQYGAIFGSIIQPPTQAAWGTCHESEVPE
jgi:hypothetical protein